MRNRAKCKLCNNVIESFSTHDYVTCGCGEISIDGGSEYLRSRARDYQNFLRVDDEGNEIVVTFQENISEEKMEDKEVANKPNKKEIISMLENMIKSIESLPPSGMYSPVTHYDLCSALLLICSFFKAQD